MYLIRTIEINILHDFFCFFLCCARKHNIRAHSFTKKIKMNKWGAKENSSTCSIVYFELFKIGIELNVFDQE